MDTGPCVPHFGPLREAVAQPTMACAICKVINRIRPDDDLKRCLGLETRGWTVRTRLARVIYHKWFYGVLAVMFWFHFWTDVEDVIKTAKPHEVISVIISGVGAIVLTTIFIDLHLRWPSGGQ
jgi:hypothetical protein